MNTQNVIVIGGYVMQFSSIVFSVDYLELRDSRFLVMNLVTLITLLNLLQFYCNPDRRR